MPYQHMTKAERMARDAEWVRMRTMGMQYQQIAQGYGVTEAAVRGKVTKLLRERLDMAVDQHRDVLIAQCQFVMESLAAQVEAGDAQAATSYLRAVDKLAQLTGANTPTVLEHHHGLLEGSVQERIQARLRELEQ